MGMPMEFQSMVQPMKPTLVVAGADYHHVETKLLEPTWRNYSEGFWDKQVMHPH